VAGDVAALVGGAPAALLEAGAIAVYRGHWADGDPRPVPGDEPLRLLRDPVWSSYRVNAPDEEFTAA
jgi:hypothetical protein